MVGAGSIDCCRDRNLLFKSQNRNWSTNSTINSASSSSHPLNLPPPLHIARHQFPYSPSPSSPKQYLMASWETFPPELQILVWQALIDAHGRQDGPATGLTSYACVSKSWQYYFEQKTFRSFTLDKSHFLQFIAITTSKRRRTLVKHVLLQFLVHPSFEGPETGIYSYSDHLDVECFHTVAMLLRILSSWDVWSEGDGLTLELGACTSIEATQLGIYHRRAKLFSKFLEGSPASECNYPPYVFDDKGLGIDCAGFQNPPAEREALALWNKAKRKRLGVKSLNIGSSAFISGSPRIVTKLLIRLEYFPNFDPRTIAKILQQLPRVQHFHLERWQFGRMESDRQWNVQSYEVLKDLGTHMKTLTIFEESDTDFHRQSRFPPPTRYCPKLLRLLFISCQHLEHLAFSYFVDAPDAFLVLATRLYMSGGLMLWSPRLPEPPELSLKSLALTASKLTSASASDVAPILRSAAEAATRMPCLQTLELWNHDKGEMAIFRYHRTEETSEIVWQSTQDMELGSSSMSAWKRVVAWHSKSRHELKATVTRFPEKAKASYDVLQHLQLKELVIHDMSAHQLEKEFMRVE
ncbi:hypothetical protein B0T10DRAFT_545306 [Thelonectria olida]|uniref:DUF6546 domain-containing protein n=1 Tax=Thelonectria olida TaxID=1576542 RepID=A0A9P8WCI7_9HYPO|nr:hypothetical protein B0T10DRAFT_545306 [Thelonectria olida]